MTELVVTFSRGKDSPVGARQFPVARGASARTEIIAIAVESVQGILIAQGREEFVVLKAPADCWVAIGSNPVAAAPTLPSESESDDEPTPSGSWYMAEGERLEFYIDEGDRVAVIEHTPED
jgi:hypothetical protein